MLEFRDRGTSGTQLDVLCGDVVIAFLYKAVLSVVASQTPRWHWTFHITAKAPGFDIHGTAASCEEAKQAVEEHWRLWLAAAGLQ
jgi:hypothetical protein